MRPVKLGVPAFLLLGLALTLAAVACEPAAEEPEAAAPGTPPADTPEAEAPEDAAEPAPPDAYQEAPEFAELVAAGELPPVEERLPDEPVVIQPYERVGVYGGQWRTTILGAANQDWIMRTVGYEPLLRWSDDLTTGMPNVAERVEVNDDATQFTFHLRPGLRWSDGELFTAHDVDFWYNDVATHEELAGGTAPLWMTTAGQAGSVEAVDDHTVVFSFPVTHGVLLQRLAMPDGMAVVGLPRHHLERYHADYNPDVDALVDEAGVPDWVELFALVTNGGPNSLMFDPDLPTLLPWRMTERVGDADRVVFERNPYYWKVDPDGNQLPYLDRVVFEVVENDEVTVFRGISGELDIQTHYGMRDFANIALYADHRESGDYRFITEEHALTNTGVIQLNLTHKDPVLREVFQNRDFRVGLSHAIDRQAIIDIVFVGQGEPFQTGERPEDGDFYDEEMGKQYTEYDVDLANEYLDRAGYAERDGDGYRLRPDGERITFAIESDTGATERNAIIEMVARDWAEVGIDMRPNIVDRSLHSVRIEDNDHDGAIWDGGGGRGDGLRLNPRHYFPATGGSHWAIAWANWYQSGGELGEEPPEPARRQMELFDQFLTTADRDRQAELYREILEIAKEEFYVIGTSLWSSRHGIVKNNIHNVPDTIIGDWHYASPAGPGHPEQFFADPQ